MPPKPTGRVIERTWPNCRTYALRFRAYGKRHYLTLGSDTDGWTPETAHEELQNILADVRRSIWIPPTTTKPTPSTNGNHDTPDPAPVFGDHAPAWLKGRKGEVAVRTQEFYDWALNHHLQAYFGPWPLPEITVEAVDDYRKFKVEQAKERRRALERDKPLTDHDGHVLRPLSHAAINKTIDVLQAILELAVEYGHITTNPASGKRRRLKIPARPRVYLDTAEQIQALLDAAQHLDNRNVTQTFGRRALIATLILAGPRAHEACDLTWRDVDLAHARINIRSSKTAAGLREIPLLPLLRTELIAHKARTPYAGLDDPVFPTRTGRPRDKDNIRNRVVQPIARHADTLLAARGQSPLPNGLTPHKLRHTFSSVLAACGEDPASIMAQLGHTDAKFTLRVYTHVMRRDPTERQRLKNLVHGDNLNTPSRPARPADPHDQRDAA